MIAGDSFIDESARIDESVRTDGDADDGDGPGVLTMLFGRDEQYDNVNAKHTD